MRKIFIALLLMLSMTAWSQINLSEDPTANILEATFCFPLTEYGDSIVTLKCDNVILKMPLENLNQQFILIINPSAERDSTILPGKNAIQWFLPPEDNHRFLPE